LINAQKTVVILNSGQSKEIISQLEECDKLKQLESISQERIFILKDANSNLLKAFDEKQKEVNKYKEAVTLQEKVIKREKNKKTFYQISTIALILFVLLK